MTKQPEDTPEIPTDDENSDALDVDPTVAEEIDGDTLVNAVAAAPEAPPEDDVTDTAVGMPAIVMEVGEEDVVVDEAIDQHADEAPDATVAMTFDELDELSLGGDEPEGGEQG